MDESDNERCVTVTTALKDNGNNNTRIRSRMQITVFIFHSFISSWGLVQPGILSVPELAHHIAEAWVSGAVLASSVVQYKRHNPGKVRTTHALN